MRSIKNYLRCTLFVFFTGILTTAFANLPVTVFNQNIQANLVCADANKKAMFKTFINKHTPDFILTQEYETNGQICVNFFNEIKAMGYDIVQGVPRDTTLFYKTSKWQPVEEIKLDMNPNSRDKWGHDGLRQAMFGLFRSNTDPEVVVKVGNAHLCIGYESSYCMNPNGTPADEVQVHTNDFEKMLDYATMHPDWIIAGDMNIPANVKSKFINQINSRGANNITQLNSHSFDMAFYKGNKIIDMQYKSAADELPLNVFSDHEGFTLSFSLNK